MGVRVAVEAHTTAFGMFARVAALPIFGDLAKVEIGDGEQHGVRGLDVGDREELGVERRAGRAAAASKLAAGGSSYGCFQCS